jgi:hypothetical protein
MEIAPVPAILGTTQSYGETLENVLHNSGKMLHHSHILEAAHAFVLQVLEESRCQTCNFLELVRKMRHTAVVEFVRNLRQTKFIIDKQFLYSLDLVFNDKMFDCRALYLRK